MASRIKPNLAGLTAHSWLQDIILSKPQLLHSQLKPQLQLLPLVESILPVILLHLPVSTPPMINKLGCCNMPLNTVKIICKDCIPDIRDTSIPMLFKLCHIMLQ